MHIKCFKHCLPYTQYPVNVRYFDVPEWARRSEIQRLISLKDFKVLRGPSSPQVKPVYPHQGKDSVRPGSQSCWMRWCLKAQVAPVISCLNLSSLVSDWPLSLMPYLLGTEPTVQWKLHLPKSHAWGSSDLDKLQWWLCRACEVGWKFQKLHV